MKHFLKLFCLALMLAIPMAGVRADDEADKIQAVIAKAAPSIVTVKAVMKMEMKMMGEGESHESRSEMQGVVVSSDGLIMISNSSFSTDQYKSLFGGSGLSDSDIGIKIVPTEFKVIVEREQKEYPAYLAGTDEHLGLAFLKMDELGDRQLTAVDFPAAADLTTGQKAFSVARLSKGFDYAPYCQSGRVTGEIAKPRKAWVLDGISGIGLPAFTESGDVAGVVTMLTDGLQDSGGADRMAGIGMLMSLFSGGGAASHMNIFLVPNTEVTGVIAQAKIQAADVAALRAKSKAAAAAVTSKTPLGKKDTPKAAPKSAP